MLIDTHAHLDFPDFANDLEDVLRRAEEADVRRIITIGTSIESSRRAIELAENYPSVYAAIGVHPSHAEEAEEDVITPLRELAKNPRVVAIGETGLDYHHLATEMVAKEDQVQVMTALRSETDEEIEAQIRDGAFKSKQASLFQQQLDLAVELGLNVVIHQRDAWEDTLEVLRAYTGKVRGVFHCFGGSLDQANEVLDLEHLVSFTGIVTFKNGLAVRQVAAEIPLWKFMVETDCPFLAPGAFSRKALRTCAYAHRRRSNRYSSRNFRWSKFLKQLPKPQSSSSGSIAHENRESKGAGARRGRNTAQIGGQNNSSLSLDRNSHRFIHCVLCGAGHAAPNRDQHTRSKVGASRSRQPHGYLSCLHLQVRSWRLARQQVYAARQFAGSGKNWRQCATGDGVQKSAAHRRTRPGQFARSRSDRDADSLVAWTGSAKCQRVWEGHLHSRHTRGMENRFARELRMHPDALRRHNTIV